MDSWHIRGLGQFIWRLGSGIEGARAYTMAQFLFSICTVGGGVFSHDGLTRLWVTFLYCENF